MALTITIVLLIFWGGGAIIFILLTIQWGSMDEIKTKPYAHRQYSNL